VTIRAPRYPRARWRRTRSTALFEPEPWQKTADVKLASLGLLPGATIAYIFDFGDMWKVLLTVLETAPAGNGPYPRIVASRGEAPPQYEDQDDEPEPQ
jgi:hypothetical protein